MKKGILLTFLLMVVLMAVSVTADPLTAISGFLNSVFGFIGSTAFLGAAQFGGLLKLLYAGLVFTLLFSASALIRDHLKKGPAVAISIIIAILVALVTPTTMLLAFVTTYATLTMGILFGVPVGGILWFTVAHRTKTWGMFIAKLIVIMLGFWITSQFVLSVQGRGGSFVQAVPTSAGVAGSIITFFTEWAPIVFALALFWVIVDFWFLAGREERGGSEDSDDGGDAAGKREGLRTSIGGWIRNNLSVEKEFTEDEIILIRNAENALTRIDAAMTALPPVPTDAEVRTIAERFRRQVLTPLAKAAKIEKKALGIMRDLTRKERRAGTLDARDRTLMAEAEAIGNEVRAIINGANGLRELIEELERILGGSPAPTAAAVSSSRGRIMTALAGLRGFMTSALGHLGAFVAALRGRAASPGPSGGATPPGPGPSGGRGPRVRTP
ncbi:hypothetical protein COY27_04120 [Candidatus Woesearchaeota archaeon CG_4_10_14_0_2_um_filter_33_13]|nr:MAG: hypothetical protein COY27_04120 [Candidatus Woesearchaeota archaeon CG_4_10_14_0_2_um_filter_33_13]